MFISHAQNFEDVILWRALKDVAKGFYIDIGAWDPVLDSVSLAFYERGWRGIHVEPVSAFADKLRAARPDEKVIEAAIATKAGEIALFEFEGTGLSTCKEVYARRHLEQGFKSRKTVVPTQTLASILNEAEGRDIHWMKIDVEGMEGDVLSSWARAEARPWILVIESTRPLTQTTDFKKWERRVLGRGYKFVYFDGLNRFYVHEAHADLRTKFGPGPNFFDGFTLAERSPFVGDLCGRVDAAEERTARMAQALTHQEATAVEAVRAMEVQAADLKAAVETARAAASAEAAERRNQLEAAISEKELALSNVEQRLAVAIEERARLEDLLKEQSDGIAKAVTETAATVRAEANERAAALETALAQKELALSNVEQSLAIAVEERTRLTHSLKKQSNGIDQAVAEAAASARAEANETTAELEAALAAAQQTTAAATQALEAANRAITEREAAIVERDHRLAALAHENSLANLHAQDAEATVAALRASTSWHVSAPIRWIGLRLRALIAPFKSILRPALERSLAFVRRYPFLKPLILQSASHAPSVKRKLIHFGQVRAPLASERDENLKPNDGMLKSQESQVTTKGGLKDVCPSALLPRARRILADLS